MGSRRLCVQPSLPDLPPQLADDLPLLQTLFVEASHPSLLNFMQKKSLNVSSDSSSNMVVREGDHEAHPCASPFGQQSCAKRLSCRFVEPCRGFSPLSPEFYAKKKSEREFRLFFKYGGERGVRTLDTLPYTHFPGVLLQPLGHLTILLSQQGC